MRITKVNVEGKPVVMVRDEELGVLKHNKSNKKNDEINQFILSKKQQSIVLSLINSVVKKEDKDVLLNDAKKTIRTLLTDQIEKKLSKLTDINHAKNKPNTTTLAKDNIKKSIKYQFNKTINGESYSKYVEEIAKSVNQDNPDMPHLAEWIKRRLEKFKFIANSIDKNKIVQRIPTPKNKEIHSKRKQFLQLLFDNNKKNKSVEASIAEFDEKYLLNDLVTLLQQCRSEFKSDKKKDEEDNQIKLNIQLKDQLNLHCRKIFGTREAENKENRENIGLYSYHQEVVEYFKCYFPFKGALKKESIDNEYYLNLDTIKKTIISKIKNRLTQYVISCGKIIHHEMTTNNNQMLPISSDSLQEIKTHETFKRKLSDDISFAANQLKNQLINVFTEENVAIINEIKRYLSENNRAPEKECQAKARADYLIEFHQRVKSNFPTLSEAINDYCDVLHDIISIPISGKEKGDFNNKYGSKNNELIIINDQLNREDTHYNKITEIMTNGDLISDLASHLYVYEENTQVFVEYLSIANISAEQQSLILSQLNALNLLRNAVFHVQNIKEKSFDTDYCNTLFKLISEDSAKIKQLFIEKLLSNNVLTYYSKEEITQVLDKPLIISKTTIAFAPAFKNVLARARGLKKSWAPEKKLDASEHIEERNARNHALYYLLDILYYHYFLPNFTDDKQAFFKAVTSVKEHNNETKGYKQFVEIDRALSPADYLACIQSLEIARQDVDSQKKEQKEQPYFQRYIRDIFVTGFSTFIQSKAQALLKQLKRQEVEQKYTGKEALTIAVNDFSALIKIETLPQLNSPINSIWYGLVSLLDNIRLSQLRGDILRYQQMSKADMQPCLFASDLTHVITLINIRLFQTSKSVYGLNNSEQQDEQLKKQKQADYSDLFPLFFKLETDNVIESLKAFEPEKTENTSGKRTQMYLADDRFIEKKAFDNVLKYQLVNLFKRLSLDKITKKEAQQFYQREKEITKTISDREKLHKQWVDNKDNKDKKAEVDNIAKNYSKLINTEHDFVWLRNKMNLTHVERLSALLNDIQSLWIKTTYLWERDIYYVALTVLKAQGKLNDEYIQNELKKDEGKVSFVYELKKEESLKDISLKIESYINLCDCNKEIRNSIAHYHYFQNKNNESLLDYLAKMVQLMSYDRKLKNSVAKSFIDLLGKHGIIIKFKSLHKNQHQFVIEKIESKKINHLGGLKCKGAKEREFTIQSGQVHSEYVDMVKALLNLDKKIECKK